MLLVCNCIRCSGSTAVIACSSCPICSPPLRVYVVPPVIVTFTVPLQEVWRWKEI